MNKDELIKLREELAKKKFYCAVFDGVDSTDSRIVEIDDKRIPAIEKMDQTHEVLKKCESLIEKALITSYEEGIPVEIISLDSKFGVISEAQAARDYVFYRNTYLKSEPNEIGFDFYKRELDASTKEFKSSIRPDYIPVRISLDPVFSEINGMDAYDISDEKRLPIFKETVTGVVNFKQFILGLKELGYELKTFFGYEFKSFYGQQENYSDYIDAFTNVDESKKETGSFIISADLTKKSDNKSNKAL